MPTHPQQQQRRRQSRRRNYTEAPAPPTPPRRRTQTDIKAVVGGGGDRSRVRYHRVDVEDDDHAHGGWSSSCCGSSYNSDAEEEEDTLTLEDTRTLDDGYTISPRRGTFLGRPHRKQQRGNTTRQGRSSSGNNGAERGGCVQQISTEVSGACEDTVTSLDQVCHAFTVTSPDIHAVTRKIYKAQRQYYGKTV